MYDTIIVGGGSAGSVLANRLSAQSNRQVLLCEAGQDTPHGAVPKEISDSYPGTAYFDPRFHWTALKVTSQVIAHNAPDTDRPPLRKYEQARVLGGGSSINGQLANRGAPTDYAEWVARGADGWGWDDVLPYFRKVERDLDFDGPYHGKEGRIPVRRIMPEHWDGHARATAAAFEAAGFAYLPDQNGKFEDGYFPVTISNAEEKPGFGRHRLSRSADPPAAQSDDPHRHAGGRLCCSTATRCTGDARRRPAATTEDIAGTRGDPVLRRHPQPGASAARRDRPGRPSARPRHSGAGRRSRASGSGLTDHPSISLSSFLHREARMTGEHDAPAYPGRACAIPRGWTARRRATCS